MYNLVIVDDESVIRQGMCNYIPWSEMGFHVAADFEDGKETIEYIKNHPVDVIITDIEMAEVTGLDLTRYIHEEMPDIKVVILSGYKVFEYARKAVEFNVEHFLLKPINLDEVKEVFDKIKRDLDSERSTYALDMTRQKEFEAVLNEFQEQFFVSLLVGGVMSNESIAKKSKLLRLDLNVNHPCALLDLKIQQIKADEVTVQEQQQGQQELLHSMFGQKNEDIKYYVANLASDIIKVVAICNEQIKAEAFLKQLESQVDDKCEIVLKLLEIDIKVSIEKVFENMQELMAHKYTLQMHVQSDNTGIKLVPDDYRRLMQKYKLLIEIINDGDFESLNSLVDNIFFEFRKLPLDYVKNLTIDMFSMLSNKFINMGSNLWANTNEILNYKELLDLDHIDQLKRRTKELLQRVITLVDDAQNDVSKSVVEQAIEYIKENYGEDISLNTIADRYFLNPNYFSRLFKRYTGSTFTDYLMEIRMKMAKELIRTGKYKMYEIGGLVGYTSSKYFFRVFKQFTGCSPAEFSRSQVMNDGKET